MENQPGVDPLRYRQLERPAPGTSEELLTVKVRYKEPGARESKLSQFAVIDRGRNLSAASRDFKFAAAVAEFGMLLRESPHKGKATFDSALDLAKDGLGPDDWGYRHEFVELIQKAKELRKD